MPARKRPPFKLSIELVEVNGNYHESPTGKFETRKTVRYRVDWNSDVLRRMIRRARSQTGGRAKFGPITVTVHPDDRDRA